jgi:D-arabinose 1-dehydrogenase-like Zn-dependent alcohol dehydrogenase
MVVLVHDGCASSILQIHGGSSGIGTFAIQIAKRLGIKVFVTAGLFFIMRISYSIIFAVILPIFLKNIIGSEEKLAACKGLGADVCINYKTEDFVERVKQETNGKGITYYYLIILNHLYCMVCLGYCSWVHNW